jgi:predicted nucleic acid-binding protein
MAVVSDTSPLRYFIANGYADVLRQVFGSLIIPELVLSELSHPSAPLVVRNWCSSLPNWISLGVLSGSPDPALAKSLDPGEAAAIQLAIEIKAHLLLIDERVGRYEATRRGVAVVGALGVLREGFRRGFVADPMAAVAAMRSGGFRVSKRLIDEFQEGIEAIRQGKGSPE